MGSKSSSRDISRDDLSQAFETGDARLIIEILVMRHGDYIYGYCRRLLGNTTEAEDVSQTVFVHALRDLKDLSDIQGAQGWLRGIARHRCMDRLRARQRDLRVIDSDDSCSPVDERLAVVPSDHDPRIASALDDCLGRLDARSRAVLALRFHDGLSFEEISTLTSDTSGALRVRLARALQTLRRCLEGKGVRP